MTPLRAIALDLDGTLLDERMSILPENRQALQAARERGIEVVLVTGRHHRAAQAFHAELALDTPAVCCNGIYLQDYAQDRPLHGDPLAVEQRLALLALLRGAGHHALAYLDQGFAFEDTEPVLQEVMDWAATLAPALQPRFDRVADLAPVLAQAPRVWKMAVSVQDPAEVAPLAARIGDELGLGTLQTGPLRLDVGRPGHDKSTGLARWLATRGLSAAQVVAFGDNHNDTAMLRAAGHGVAMAGAPQAVREAADEVCGSNEQPSIAAVLQRLQAEGRLG
ncbi:MAG: hypothetical protein RLY78_3713 [Pseudomonadota bacterium]|jgi:Cof subfamily protein (haloacid dehalogenase superfamily)